MRLTPRGTGTLQFVLLLMLFALPCEAQNSVERKTFTVNTARQHRALNATLSVEEAWKDVKIRLLRLGGPPPEEAGAKRAVYVATSGKHKSTVPVIAFVAPTSGRSWVGPEQDVYVEAKTEIAGFHLYARNLIWCENLWETAPKTQSLAAVVAKFEQDVTAYQLLDAVHPFDEEERLATLTPLNRIKNDWMFTAGRFSSQVGNPKIVSAEMDGRLTIKLELTDQTETFHATVWLNGKSRQVTKVVEEPWEETRKIPEPVP